MAEVFFFLAAIGALAGAVGVVTLRNPFYSVLALICHLLSLAALFLLLRAEFVAAAQVVVYAGAVMVLFLFIIMLLDLRAEERRKINVVAVAGGAAVALALFVQICLVVGQLRGADVKPPALPANAPDDVRQVGLLLFGNYNLPFQVIAVLVLVATIGVIVLSKRELR